MHTHRICSLVLSSVLASGCASWHTIGEESPAAYLMRARPRVARLSLAESTLVLSRPVLHGDSVVGLAKEAKPSRPVAVPTADIRKLEVCSAKGSMAAKVAVGTFWVTGLALMVALAFHHPRIP